MRLGDLPLAFVENIGQVDDRVRFYANSGGQTLWLTADAVVFDLFRRPVPEEPSHTRGRPSGSEARDARPPARERLTVTEHFVGASPDALLEGRRVQAGRYNFLFGSDPDRWRSGAQAYAEVIYRNVYDGIDLKLFARGRDLEQEFIVRPGGDPSLISIAYSGISSLRLDPDGSLRIQTDFGELRESAPRIYQNIDGRHVAIEGRFKLLDDAAYTFEIGRYDPEHAVVIDPTLVYSTYLGGAGEEVGNGIAVDGSGSAYVVGHTNSLDFPLADAVQPVFGAGGTQGSRDAFVTKLNPAGTALVYSTYLGGNDLDEGRAIAVDGAGNAYVTGRTFAGNFPTVNAFQPLKPGDSDAFVAKLNAAGSALVYSTYLGGFGADEGNGIVVDATGNAYVTGLTIGAAFNNFPTTAGAFQTTYGGGSGFFGGDGFATKVSATGALVYSTFLGGSGDERGTSVAVDTAGNAYVAGWLLAGAIPFPVTTGAFQTVPASFGAGGAESFVAKLNSSGTALVYSTLLGGNGSDAVAAITVDVAGHAYVAGGTSSSTFPTQNAIQSQPTPGGDVFVTKFNPAGSGLVYSTLLGGNWVDQASGMALDAAANVHIVGYTLSTDFPTQNPFQGRAFGSDAFVAKINSSGSGLVYSSFLGGTEGATQAFAVAVDGGGNAFLTGTTSAPNFNTTAFAFDRSLGGAGDAFVTKINDPVAFAVTAILPDRGGDTGSITAVIHGAGFAQGATAQLAGAADIPAASVTVGTGGLSLTAVFDLNGAPRGTYDVEVTNPNGAIAMLQGAFVVEAGVGPQLWVDVVGPTTIGTAPRDARKFYILYGNRGNTDAVGVPVWVRGIPRTTNVRIGSRLTPPPEREGVPVIDWDEVSPVVTTDSDQVIPLFVPVIQPASSGVIEVTLGGGESFELAVTAYQPYFNSATDLLQLTGEASECVIAAVTTLMSILGMVIPGASCLTQTVLLFFAQYLNTVTATMRADERALVASWVQLASQLLFLIATRCGANVIPVLSNIYQAIEVVGGLWQTFLACAPIAEKLFGVQVAQSIDPNEKFGPEGSGPSRYLSGEEPLRYAILFENLAEATAPAQEVVITDQLDATSLDLNTLTLDLVTFGDTQVLPARGAREFTTNVDLRPAKNLIVRVDASLNPATALLTWHLTAIDPATGQLPLDRLAGFLPPNANPPEGQGSVFFTIMPNRGLATGTEVRNQASIVFDVNAPISTSEWLTTIDNAAPSSQVLPLGSPQSPDFRVEWSGTDDGAGVQDYSVFVAENGGPFIAWLRHTTATSATFTGQLGTAYAFFSVARDRTGNIESAPITPDVSVLLTDTSPPLLTLPGGITVNATSPAGAIVTYSVGATDNFDADPDVACTPASGSTFGIGTTAVQCSAVDASSNTAQGGFSVTVNGAAIQIVQLIEKTLAFVGQPALRASLKARLEAIAAALAQRKPQLVCAGLQLYIVAVSTASASSGLTAAEKAELIADATRIKAVVGCP